MQDQLPVNNDGLSEFDLQKPVLSAKLNFYSSLKKHFFKLGIKGVMGAVLITLLMVGGVAAFMLAQTSQDLRQQAAGFGSVNVYSKCDYSGSGGNTKPVCLDSEATWGNCVMCVNGEKHILPNSDCGTLICAKPQPKTCSDGKNIFNEGGTACNSYTDCLKCSDGHWVAADRWNCDKNSTCFAAEPTKAPTATPIPLPTTTHAPTPTLRVSPSPSLALLPDGSRCSTNAQCQAGNCVPTPYGNYCGPISGTKCTASQAKCEGGYEYSCNSNGFFVKSARCDGGCSPSGFCNTGVCTPGKTECDGTAVKACNSTGTAWVKSSCWSGSCKNGACVPVPTASRTPTRAPTPTIGKSPDGSRCSLNSDCIAGNCVPTPYGNFCGPITGTKCWPGTDSCGSEGNASYVYSCNSNGFLVKSERCDGGCNNGMCATNFCVANEVKCDGLGLATCIGGKAWQHQSCGSGFTCIGKACVAGPVESCSFAGTCYGSRVCEGQNDYYYQCQNGHWQIQADNKPIRVSGDCEADVVAGVAIGLSKIEKLLSDFDEIKIQCGAHPDHPTWGGWVDIADVGLVDVHVNCGATGIDDTSKCTNTIIHEMAHRWAYEKYQSFNVPSYSQTNGCRKSTESQAPTYRFSEYPPVDYGRINCAEAFSTTVELYLKDPCEVRRKSPRQFEWFEKHPDSPYNGQNQCPNP